MQTLADVVLLAESELRRGPPAEPYAAAVVNDAQDLSVPMLRLLALLAPDALDGLTLAGDARPSLGPGVSSLGGAGIDVEGRVVPLVRDLRALDGRPTRVVELLASRADCDARLVSRVGKIVATSGATASRLTGSSSAR